MNKKVLIGVGALIVIAGLIFYFNPPQQNGAMDGAMEGSNNTQEEIQNLSQVEGTLQDLYAQGRPIQCTFAYDSDGTQTSGKVYIADDRMRGDFTASIEGQEFMTHMIRNEEFMYTWTDEQGQGIQLPISQVDDVTPPEGQDGLEEQQPVDLENQTVDYSCEPWTADEAFFTPPANIEFMELGEQFQDVQDQIQNTQESVDEQQCDACENLPAGEARDACLQSLGCN